MQSPEKTGNAHESWMRVYPMTPLPNSPPEDIPKVCRVRVPWCWERHTEPKLIALWYNCTADSWQQRPPHSQRQLSNPPGVGQTPMHSSLQGLLCFGWLPWVMFLKVKLMSYRAKARRVQSKSLFHTCCVSMDTAQDRARASVSHSLSTHRTVFRPSQSTR